MIGFFLLLPACISMKIQIKRNGNKMLTNSILCELFRYGSWVLGVNLLTMFCINYPLGIKGVAEEAFCSFQFAIKYLEIAILTAIVVPYVLEALGKYIFITLRWEKIVKQTVKKTDMLVRNIIGISVLFVLFIVALLCNSASWLLEMFGPISFSTVLYQLNAPLRGTGHDILHNYLTKCMLKSALEILCFGIIWGVLAKVRRKLELRVEGRILGKGFCLSLSRKTKYGKFFAWGGIALFCVISLSRYAHLVGIPEYIDQISNASVLYEEEFVMPDSVKLSFPEQKKNLIYIYMESMETTYASKEAGGGKAIDYIPWLTELANENISFSDTDALGGGDCVIWWFRVDYCCADCIHGRRSLWIANRRK